MSDRYHDTGAAGYDETCGFASLHFVPTLLQQAHLAPGQSVLDVAIGTGNAAEAAAGIVGASGSVMATDLSVGMLDEARKRLAHLRNVSYSVEDGHARGLSEFHRVLKVGGRASISVTANAERSFYPPVRTAMSRHMPPKAKVTVYRYTLGDESYLRNVFEKVGFRAPPEPLWLRTRRRLVRNSNHLRSVHHREPRASRRQRKDARRRGCL